MVSKLKRLADAKAFKSLRSYVRSHIANKRAKEVGKAIRDYMQEGNSATINSYMRSYTHSAAGTVIDSDIKSLIKQIAASQHRQQVNDILATLEARIQAMKGLYAERNQVLNTIIDASDERYQLLVDARGDFYKWYTGVNKDLRASLSKYYRQTSNAMIPDKIRSKIIEWSDDFEMFYRSIGIRSDRVIN